MRVSVFRSNRLVQLLLLAAAIARAQDLVPRAYLITPTGSNAITLAWSFNTGDITFDPSLPIEDSSGRFQTQVLSFYHSFAVFARSSNIVVSLPYAAAHFEAVVRGNYQSIRRSGMADARVRLSVNLRGGPAMRVADFVNWHERTLIGVSLTAVVPTGQNDPARAVNIGSNRWAVKPELGITRRRGRWVGEIYGGAWLFAANPRFFPGDNNRTQRAMGAVEMHLGYYLKPRLWASLDGNYWSGGRSAVNGIANHDAQTASRIGVTVSVPMTRRQSIKVSYSRGAYVALGGNYETASTGWQYAWMPKAK